MVYIVNIVSTSIKKFKNTKQKAKKKSPQKSRRQATQLRLSLVSQSRSKGIEGCVSNSESENQTEKTQDTQGYGHMTSRPAIQFLLFLECLFIQSFKNCTKMMSQKECTIERGTT